MPVDLQSLYRRERDALLAYLARRTADPELALELLAETFAQAVASRGRFRGDSDAAWLYGIAKHQLALYYRRGRVEQRALKRLGIEPPPPTPEALAEITRRAALVELRDELAVAMATLSPGTRDAVRLRVVDELSYGELAQRLGISEGAARVRVSRGLSALAVEMTS
ncbi:RNA polymerase sigma factor [Solirubrobacter phytolaccae]|uniref:RNA polymerase sigma factor n=1 Tax=Solirubrobacter phytolaccae TaxID=1404360 RepID=A0A9X3NFA0_9ACTN|nr:RNA polymerase sigma factor [Solirubrobacter phytolaccae]MDA0183915.1 RNA polymerase sigma factor [Solirubrobacter phytolaccae]